MGRAGLDLPADVDIPAPVKAMKCLLPRIRDARISAFLSIPSTASMRSSSAILGTEVGIVGKCNNYGGVLV